MKLKNILKVAAAVSTLALLSACSTTGSGASGNGTVGSYGSGVSSMGLGGPATINGFNTASSPNRMKAPFNQIYFFDFDSNVIHAQDVPSVEVQGNYLASHSSASVLLTGNTDDRGSPEYNMALGQRRALAVANRLQSDGASASQIQTVSYGAEKPIVPGDNQAAWAQNRNVQLSYQSK